MCNQYFTRIATLPAAFFHMFLSAPGDLEKSAKLAEPRSAMSMPSAATIPRFRYKIPIPKARSARVETLKTQLQHQIACGAGC